MVITVLCDHHKRYNLTLTAFTVREQELNPLLRHLGDRNVSLGTTRHHIHATSEMMRNEPSAEPWFILSAFFSPSNSLAFQFPPFLVPQR